jgi:hypothetical protein
VQLTPPGSGCSVQFGTRITAAAPGRAAVAHGEHEERTGERAEEWPTWYAADIVAEQVGTDLPR